MAITVTATGSPGAAALCYLFVRVLTGATEAGGAAASGVNASGGTSNTFSLTPNGSHSLPLFALTADGTVMAWTAATNNTFYAPSANDTDDWSWADGFYSGTVTAGTGITLGASATGTSDNFTWAGYEVLASGGSTPAVDGSSPALVSAASVCTTASFSPPPGSVLAAMFIVSTAGTDASATVSGGGLTWTQRAGTAVGTDQAAFIFTATVPGGGGNPVPPLPPFMFPPLSRSFGPYPPFEVAQPYPSAPAAAPSAPAPFRLPGLLRGPAAAVKGRLASARGRAGVPAPFTPPRAPARGPAAARPGRLASAAAPPPPVVPPSVPSPFFPPRVPLRGTPAARPGRLARSAGRPGTPAPFRPPGGLLRGRSAAVKGTLGRLAGAPGKPSPFRPPSALLRGQRPARPGILTGRTAPPAAAPPVTQPSPFRLPGLLRGIPAARRGALAGLAAPPPVAPPSVPSPFYGPTALLRGTPAALSGQLSAYRIRTYAQVFTTAGTWTAPRNLAGAPSVYAWGPSGTAAGGSAGTGGGGGGGGALGAETALGGVAPGTVLTVTPAAAGSATASTVTGGTVTVTGNPGSNASGGTGGAGGVVSSNSTTFAGGAGGAGAAGGSGGGGGGGGSAGAAGAGGTGGAASGTAGGGAGTAGAGVAPLGGAPGATGGTGSVGGAGIAPGGGPGGGSGGAAHTAGAPSAGQALIVWAVYDVPPLIAPPAIPGTGRALAILVPPPRGTPVTPPPVARPRGLLRGPVAVARSVLAAARGRAGVPAPFRLPGLLRGAAAARPGRLAGIVAPPPVLHPVVTSTFKPPGFPLKGPALARPGRSGGVRGRAGVPSPFQPSHTVLHGQPAATARTKVTGATAPPPVVQPSVPSPFYPPHTPLRGQVPATARTKVTGGIAPPPAPPPVQPPHWQGSTHMVAADATGNLIQGANHVGRGGPGTDLKGDFQRSGD